jgi:hypothetical protein
MDEIVSQLVEPKAGWAVVVLGLFSIVVWEVMRRAGSSFVAKVSARARARAEAARLKEQEKVESLAADPASDSLALLEYHDSMYNSTQFLGTAILCGVILAWTSANLSKSLLYVALGCLFASSLWISLKELNKGHAWRDRIYAALELRRTRTSDSSTEPRPR